MGLHRPGSAAKLAPTIPHGLLSMELIVFDLDGTLLNRQSTISDYTSETLKLLSKREIAYTVATAVIGHHDEEGIARFLRERFALEES